MRRNTTFRTAAALAAAAALLAACSEAESSDNDADDASSNPSTPAEESTSPTEESSSPTEDSTLPNGVLALPEADTEGKADLTAGRYRIDLTETLAFDVDVPDGTTSHDDGLFLATPGFVLKTEAAGEEYGVPGHPCTDQAIEPVGPTVDDLVAALADLPIYQTTAPEAVEIGGADGAYLEARIPRSYDASQCTGEAVQLPGNPSTAVGAPPPYIGRWWVLDVDGQRVVIQQNCWGCSTDDLEGPARMARSITFTPAP